MVSIYLYSLQTNCQFWAYNVFNSRSRKYCIENRRILVGDESAAACFAEAESILDFLDEMIIFDEGYQDKIRENNL